MRVLSVYVDINNDSKGSWFTTFSALRPGLLESADGSGFLYLIMPIRLNV